MSDDLWNEAMSAVPGTTSVERTVGGIEKGGDTAPSNLGNGVSAVGVRGRIDKTNLPGQGAWGHSNNSMPVVQQREMGTLRLGGSVSQEQQVDQFIEGHKREKTLRTVAKEKEKFRKEDAFEYQATQARHRLAATLVTPLPKQMAVGTSFPAHVFPEGARKWISGFANAYGVHPCVGGGMLKGVLSISVNGKVKVQRHDEHEELMTLYQLISMNSGKGKSPMLETALRPIKALEKKLQTEYFDGEEKRKIERRILSKRIKRIENEAADSGECREAVDEIARIERDMPKKKALPQLMTFKFTPEGLEKEAAKQDGKLALVGAELGSFKRLPASKDDFILQAWAGESFVNTKVKEPIRIEDPCLTVLIATQEATSVNLLGDEALQEDGLVARFMPLVPPDMNAVVPGGVVTTAMNLEDNAWLERTVNEIYSIARSIDGHHHFQIQDGALRTWDAFWNYTQQQAEDEFKPAVLQAWYRKLAGTALRFSGFLHLLRCVEYNLPLETEIDQQSIDGGIELAQFYEAHARVALDIESNDVLRTANKFLQRIREGMSPEVTMRQIYHPEHVQAEEAKKAFRFLAEYGYVAILRKGKSDICLVNSRLWEMQMVN